jgi:nitrogen regulatory protein P-II 1
LLIQIRRQAGISEIQGYAFLVKLIQCIVQPYKLEEVVEALQKVAPGMTLSEAKGHGHQKGQPMLYRGHEYEVTLLPKVMIELVVDENRVDDVVKVVIEKARTGHIGDGRIFIIPVEANYHIRTGFMELD